LQSYGVWSWRKTGPCAPKKPRRRDRCQTTKDQLSHASGLLPNAKHPRVNHFVRSVSLSGRRRRHMSAATIINIIIQITAGAIGGNIFAYRSRRPSSARLATRLSVLGAERSAVKYCKAWAPMAAVSTSVRRICSNRRGERRYSHRLCRPLHAADRIFGPTRTRKPA
jgi:hypothetical protein